MPTPAQRSAAPRSSSVRTRRVRGSCRPDQERDEEQGQDVEGLVHGGRDADVEAFDALDVRE